MRQRFYYLTIITLIVLTLITSCNQGDIDGNDIEQPPLPATNTPIPSPTPQPARVVLVAPMDIDSGYVTEMQAQVVDLANSSGMILDVRDRLETGDIGDDWKIVIMLSSPENLNDLLAAGPRVQFVVVNAVGLQPAQNLSLVQGYPDRAAFIAGYVTILVAPDWRMMGLLPADEPHGAIIQEAFINGVYYLCGRCSPVYSPYVPFPQWVAMPSGTDAGTWQAQADQLLVNVIYAAYITPEAASPELLQYLAEKGLALVGSKSPPGVVRSRWAATVQQDFVSPLLDLWPSLVAGEGGRSVGAEIQLVDINPELLQPGRQKAAEDVIQQVQQGWIAPLTFSQPAQ